MNTPRTLAMAVGLTGVLIAALAIPVAAATKKLELVNGFPGKKVDVCVNGKEVKSNLRYGAFVLRTSKKASTTVRFYARDRRVCGGKLLASLSSPLDDATWILTKQAPRIVLFDNAALAQPTVASLIRAAFRHAADLGPTEFSFQFDNLTGSPVDLAADTSLKREKLDFNLAALDQVMTTKVKQSGSNVVPPDFRWLLPGLRRLEWILVGTKVANAKLVFIDRPANPL